MSPEYVNPYIKAQKNDDHDAEVIAEAATRPTVRFVELKSDWPRGEFRQSSRSRSMARVAVSAGWYNRQSKSQR